MSPMAFAIQNLYQYISEEQDNVIKQYSKGKMPDYVLKIQNDKLNHLTTIADNIDKQYKAYCQYQRLLELNETIKNMLTEKIPAYDADCAERMIDVAFNHHKFQNSKQLASALFVAYASTPDIKQQA